MSKKSTNQPTSLPLSGQCAARNRTADTDTERGNRALEDDEEHTCNKNKTKVERNLACSLKELFECNARRLYSARAQDGRQEMERN